MTAAVVEFSRLLRRAAEPATPGELVSHAINRAARRLGISRRLARAYWYGERSTVPSDLMDRARGLTVGARNEIEELDRRIARLEALLVQDADFHSSGVDAFREASRRPDRSVD